MPTNQVNPQNAPKDLTMRDFTSAMNIGGSLARGCRFIVHIAAPSALKSYPKDLHLMCESADFPGRGFSVVEARYYGPSRVYPVNSQYEPVSLSLLCRSDCRERRFFDDWLEYINPTSNFNFQYPETYYCEVNIYQYADYAGEGTATTYPPAIPQASKSWKPKVTYHWQLHKAWPTLVNAQPVNWAEQDVLRLQVSFAYKYWDRPSLVGATDNQTT